MTKFEQLCSEIPQIAKIIERDGHWTGEHFYIEVDKLTLEQARNFFVAIMEFEGKSGLIYKVHLERPKEVWTIEQLVRYLITMWPFWKEEFKINRMRCLEVSVDWARGA